MLEKINNELLFAYFDIIVFKLGFCAIGVLGIIHKNKKYFLYKNMYTC